MSFFELFADTSAAAVPMSFTNMKTLSHVTVNGLGKHRRVFLLDRAAAEAWEDRNHIHVRGREAFDHPEKREI
jgi:hypothetical protein